MIMDFFKKMGTFLFDFIRTVTLWDNLTDIGQSVIDRFWLFHNNWELIKDSFYKRFKPDKHNPNPANLKFGEKIMTVCCLMPFFIGMLAYILGLSLNSIKLSPLYSYASIKKFVDQAMEKTLLWYVGIFFICFAISMFFKCMRDTFYAETIEKRIHFREACWEFAVNEHLPTKEMKTRFINYIIMNNPISFDRSLIYTIVNLVSIVFILITDPMDNPHIESLTNLEPLVVYVIWELFVNYSTGKICNVIKDDSAFRLFKKDYVCNKLYLEDTTGMLNDFDTRSPKPYKEYDNGFSIFEDEA